MAIVWFVVGFASAWALLALGVLVALGVGKLSELREEEPRPEPCAVRMQPLD